MARETFKSTTQLEEDNTMLLGAHLNQPQLQELAMCLVVYIAATFDLVAARSNVYLTIGGTRNRDAFLLTEKGDDGNVYAGGENIIAWLEQVRDKLLTDDQARLAAQINAVSPPRKK